MKKNKMLQLLSGGVAAVLAAGLLTVGAVAVEPCAHEELEKGYCGDCEKQYVAVVNGEYYETIKQAVKAAGKQEDRALVLLTDLTGEKLQLKDVYLMVEENDSVTLSHCEISGEREEAVIVNEGVLVLKNTSVTNEGEGYALCNRGGETTLDTAELVTVGDQISVEGGKLLLQNAPKDGLLQVASALPGVFAESVSDQAVSGWIENSCGKAKYDQEAKQWSMSDSIAGHVKSEETAFVYHGQQQMPAVQVVLHGRELVEGTDYTVTCVAQGDDDAEAVEPVNVGDYMLLIEGIGAYSGKAQVKFAIDRAVPEVTWSAAADAVTYSGDPAELTAQAVVQTADGSDYSGNVHYTYRAAEGGSFKSGLPVAAGEYEVKAGVKAFANHGAGETEEILELTVAPKTVTPTVKISGSFQYNGSAHTPVPTVMDGDTVIPAEEYTVTYINNVDAGTATVTVQAKEGGNYIFSGEAAAQFTIAKAAQAPLHITGTPTAVTYGDQALLLGTGGGSTDGEIKWTVAEGTAYAAVDQKGLLTILGAGKVVITAEKAGDSNYEPVVGKWSFEIMPMQLTIDSVEATDKTFDGTKTVAIESVTLKGIKQGDDVRVRVDGLSGTVDSEKAGTYTKVKLTDPKLEGAAAKNYKLTQTEGGEAATVKIAKANLTTALESVSVRLPVGTENIVAENLGGGMPKDAGALVFTNRTQSTGEGTKAIVLKWGVDAAGKLTAQVVNSKGGDQIIFEVAVSSENYNTAVVKVVVSMGAQAVDAAKLTVTPASKELTYNGQAHKPAMTVQYNGEALTEGKDFDVKYPDDAASVGEKTATITFKDNYEGSATAKYTVTKAKLTVSGTKVADKTYNGNTIATVTVGTVSGGVQGDDVKVTATGVFADKNSGSRAVTVTYKLEGKAAGNYELAAETEKLSAKITPVTASQLNSGIGSTTTANATADHLYALRNVVSSANTALGDSGLTNVEKTNITNVKQNAENMIARVENAAAAAATESIRTTADVTAANVTVEKKAALQKAKTDLNSALTGYNGNYTAAEQKKLKDQQTNVDAALLVLTHVESTAALINGLPDSFDNVDAVTADRIKEAQKSYDALSDYEKSLLSEDAKLKLTAAGVVDSTTEPTDNPTQSITTPQPDGADRETIDLPMGIFWVAVMIAALIAVGYVWYKIKQRSKTNW